MQHLRAGLSRKAHIEYDDVVFLRCCSRFPVVAVGDQIHTPALFLKTPFDELPNSWIVFDDEDFHERSTTFGGRALSLQASV